MQIMIYEYNETREKNIEWIPSIIVSFSYIYGCIDVNGISIALATVLWFLILTEIIRKRYKIYPCLLIIVLFVLTLFSFSFLRVSGGQYTFDYLQRFLLYDLLALIVGTQGINEKEVIKGITVIGFLFLPLLYTKDFFANGSSYAMGASYMCLPILIASIIGFVIMRGITFKTIAGANIVVILLKYAVAANRGIWIILATFMFFMIFLFVARCGIRGLRKIKALLFLLIAGVAAGYMLINLETIIELLYDFMNRVFHVEIYALWKILFYLDKGDITNGRTDLIAIAYNIIRQHPIVGNGVGYFEMHNEGGHCHNILLQAMCEGGIILLAPFLCYLASVLVEVFRKPFDINYSKTNCLWLAFIFCCGIELLLISSTYWLWLQFWFFLGTYISRERTLGRFGMRFMQIVEQNEEAENSTAYDVDNELLLHNHIDLKA